MQYANFKPAWADGATFRLDPRRFPHEASYAVANENSSVSFTLNERGAVLKRLLPSSGLPISMALPASVFKGVAARAIDHGNGEVTVTLELHHEDPDLCIPLLVAHDLCDIAADWRNWADAYRIPMMMVEADGVARPLEEHLTNVSAKQPKPRRRHSNFADRRPRFLVRRTTGSLGLKMSIEGREIIART
ncbi:DUF6101 family protein [Rhizobium sp. L1K21]|uniref:DUF6101 family protein n=1 Tax=Rhizobium sp. L1K21 TaxID=2954933 RepID=UPI002092BD13|nr:DUF6101 family protein [Rhizobium sp. L1K21]MCO6186900.1 DUF6101 family protein [Rhizobium sp. L1K21]